jgi:hypothetical protein
MHEFYGAFGNARTDRRYVVYEIHSISSEGRYAPFPVILAY